MSDADEFAAKTGLKRSDAAQLLEHAARRVARAETKARDGYISDAVREKIDRSNWEFKRKHG